MSKSKRAPTPERRVVRDEANAMRLRFQAARMRVPKVVQEMAAGATLVKMADQLSLLTDTMLDGPWTPEEAEDAAARLAVRIVRERVRQIRCRDRRIA